MRRRRVDAISGDLDGRLAGRRRPAPPTGHEGAHDAGRTRPSRGLGSGKWRSGFDAKISVSFAGADAAWRGKFTPIRSASRRDAVRRGDAGKPTISFRCSRRSALPRPIRDRGAGRLTGDIVLRGGERPASAFRKSRRRQNDRQSDPARASGAGGRGRTSTPMSPSPRRSRARPPAAAAPQVSGEYLSTARASALCSPCRSAAPPQPKSGVRWSDAHFAGPALPPPSSDLELKIGALDLGDRSQAHNVQARVRMGEGKFEVSDLAMDIGGGRDRRARNAAPRRRRRGDDGAGRIEAIALDRPALRGRFGATLEFAAAATEPERDRVGAGRAGAGHLVGASAPHLDFAALDRVMTKAQAPEALIDETNIPHSLTLNWTKQPLILPDGVAPVVLNSGLARIGPS